MSTAANAHSFGAGTDTFQAFIDGSNAVLFSPVSLLPCLSLGLLLSLWTAEGMVKVWPILIAGHLAGFVLAPKVGAWVIPTLVLAGAVTATFAALLPRHTRMETMVLAAGLALLTMLVSLEGHGWLELAAPIYIGIFCAASFGVAAGAGLARLALERLPLAWVRIGLRVVASWLAAIQMLMAAFLLASVG
ncbi:hypothetical protein [Pseudooceanicola sp. C21-150M6]|uniref:hypothetical protein n=1 Tax=Pseudooceanicola sp. C21-150M6 TaxID=3434355 RepID=UPI003D7F5F2F